MQEGPYVVIQVTAVTTQERFIFKKNFFGPEKCGFYSREVTKRERLLMSRVHMSIDNNILQVQDVNWIGLLKVCWF